MLHTTESFIKQEQQWPINQKKKQEQEKKQREKEEKEKGKEQRGADGTKRPDGEKRNQKDNGQNEEGDGNAESKQTKSPEEEALLQYLRHEQEYRSSMLQNDGKGRCPFQDERLPEQIDEADQFSPDSWIPRSDKLIRLTGKHPLNAEVDLNTLFEAGLITPSPLHYVRNHGAVPHLLWENHKLEVIADKYLVFGMDDLQSQFESFNIPVFLACDGNRRKELNMVKKTRSFNFTAAAIGCSYWRGVMLSDVLMSAGAMQLVEKNPQKQFWVNYEGADTLTEGKYETCIPLDYAMDRNNDAMLAYQMNDHPIPPDHGYPLRLILPGYVGARSVKWLARIWISDHENNSYYHTYDNRQLPSFITDPSSDIAQTMFRHHSTICNEQMLNSVIVRPAQNEKIDLVDVKKGKMYRITGYAYNGSGDEIDRVEISLDGGEHWLYCVRKVSFYFRPYLMRVY
jgi:nitrate reductase (NAD(P)H)